MILQSIKMAFTSILANKMRALLTMLGIIIGVMALVVLVSLVTSATSSVSNSISSMGNDLFTVSIRDDGGAPLTLAEVESLAEDESIGKVAPQSQSSATAMVDGTSTRVSLVGTNYAYFDIMKCTLAAGRLLSQPDLDNASAVVVLSNEAAAALFENVLLTDILGRTIRTDTAVYTVIGVLAESDSVTSGSQSSYAVYLPYTLAARANNQSGVGSFYAVASESSQISAAETSLNNTLFVRFKGNTDAYYVQSMSTLAETLSSVQDTFALLLGGIAAISLLVGGIGIMNIMLVSVTERTREIGIRKAIGATRKSILVQFLLEALVICLIGCAIGIALSGLVLLVVNIVSVSNSTEAVQTLPYGFSGSVVLAAVAFSTIIGMVFGLYPAGKAARMRPIEALRYE